MQNLMTLDGDKLISYIQFRDTQIGVFIIATGNRKLMHSIFISNSY